MENKLQRYIFSLLLVVITFLGATDNTYYAVSENPVSQFTFVESYYSDASATDSDLYIPRRTSATNVLRPNGTVKRTNNSQKSSSGIVKAGKFFNLCIGSFIQKESLNIKYSFTKPAKRLIGLGKLLI